MDDGLVRNHYYRRYWDSVVLILIVVDNGLVLDVDIETLQSYGNAVLILIVVDNGLVRLVTLWEELLPQVS